MGRFPRATVSATSALGYYLVAPAGRQAEPKAAGNSRSGVQLTGVSGGRAKRRPRRMIIATSRREPAGQSLPLRRGLWAALSAALRKCAIALIALPQRPADALLLNLHLFATSDLLLSLQTASPKGGHGSYRSPDMPSPRPSVW